MRFFLKFIFRFSTFDLNHLWRTLRPQECSKLRMQKKNMHCAPDLGLSEYELSGDTLKCVADFFAILGDLSVWAT